MNWCYQKRSCHIQRCHLIQRFVSVCLLFACVCACMYFLEHQRREEREGRSPGKNNHPSTTGAFVGKTKGVQELLCICLQHSSVTARVSVCTNSYLFIFIHNCVLCVGTLILDGSLLVRKGFLTKQVYIARLF